MQPAYKDKQPVYRRMQAAVYDGKMQVACIMQAVCISSGAPALVNTALSQLCNIRSSPFLGLKPVFSELTLGVMNGTMLCVLEREAPDLQRIRNSIH